MSIKRKYKGLRVGYRLSILTATALLFIVITALIGMNNTNSLAERIDYGYEAITRPLAIVGDARSLFNAMRTNLYELAVEHNTSQQNEDLKKQVYQSLDAYERAINDYKAILESYGTNDPYEREAVDYLVNEIPTLRQNVELISETAVKIGRSADAVRMMSGSFQLAANDVANELMILTQILDAQSYEDKIAADQSQNESNFLSTCLMILGAVLMLLIAALVVRSITKPVGEMSRVLDEVSKGNLNVMVKGNYKGEFNHLKQSLNTTIGQLNDYISDIGSILADMSQGNYDVSVTGEYAGDFVRIKEGLTDIIDTTNSIMDNIRSSSEQVAAGAQQMAGSSQLLAQGAGEQTSSVAQVGAAIAAMSEQTRVNAEMAARAASLVSDIHKNADDGSVQMDRMIQAVNGINEASHNISKVIKAIDDIASQTNILALNASVEAARAGQQGKGFAVVAEEVRSLAAKSAEAAKNSEALIIDSINRAELGARIANETAASLSGIVSGVQESDRIIKDIARFSGEQGEAIAKINIDIDLIGKIVHQNSDAAREGAESSDKMSSQAELLQRLTTQFKIRDQKRLNP